MNARCPTGDRQAGRVCRGHGGVGLFGRGFLSLLPLWAGAIPIGIAYGVAARGAGLTSGETQLMSLTVFSAAAQLSTLSLLDLGAPHIVLIGTGLALNAHLLLIGLSVGRQVQVSPRVRPVAAYFLTDGAYGVAMAGGRIRLPVLLGAGVSMFIAWNLGTAIGAAAGDALPDPRSLGLDLMVPLTFLAVLIPLVKTEAAVLTALVAAATALMMSLVMPGATVLGAGMAGSAVGAWWAHRQAARVADPGRGEVRR